jgi:NitT/TauT family transport system substrate-binding protein
MFDRQVVCGSAAFAILMVGFQSIQAEPASFGMVGQPIHLQVGYQPYYAEAWSAIVLDDRKLWAAHLPLGSSVDFEPAPSGLTLITEMVAGKLQAAYVGDIPAVLGTSRPELRDIRMIALLARSSQQCNLLLVRPDAPAFALATDAVHWLDGRSVAAQFNSCSDRFAHSLFSRLNVNPGKMFDYGLDTLAEKFKSDNLDAAFVWEPTASLLVDRGQARKVAAGSDFGESDMGVLIMSQDLIAARPDVYKGWLEAELDAQLYLSDASHAANVVRMVSERVSNYPKISLWHAIYGTGRDATNLTFDYIFTPQSLKDLGTTMRLVAGARPGVSPMLRPEAMAANGALAVLAERKLASPIGQLRGQPDSAFVE